MTLKNCEWVKKGAKAPSFFAKVGQFLKKILDFEIKRIYNESVRHLCSLLLHLLNGHNII